MKRTELLRRLPAPIVTASILLLVVLAVGFWGRSVDSGAGGPVAQIPRTQAALADGSCEFAADVSLTDRWSGFAFALHTRAVRLALTDLLHSKSRYMVETNVARQALRQQMVAAVNGIIGSGRATDLQFTEFTVSRFQPD